MISSGRISGGHREIHRLDDRDQRFSLALLPVLLSLPMLYWPKVTEGDTQPWVIVGAALSALFYWPTLGYRRQFGNAMLVSVIAASALAVYYARAPELLFFVRYAGIMLTFVLLWHIASRDPGPMVGTFVRATIVIWFVIGLMQTIIIRLGLPFDIFGRFTPGRSGVPSLTAESSFYGSLSVLQIMYLFTERNWRRDGVYIALGVCSVILSGSLLSFLLLAVPAARLPTSIKALGILLIFVTVVFGIDVTSAGFFARVQDVSLLQLGPEFALRDASLNYRLGHDWFTWFANLGRELSLTSSIDFEFEYNAWASTVPLILPMDSDNILSSGGEALFRAGPMGAALIFFILAKAVQTGDTTYNKIEKGTFVLLCLLNPISLANPFLIFYIHKRYR